MEIKRAISGKTPIQVKVPIQVPVGLAWSDLQSKSPLTLAEILVAKATEQGSVFVPPTVPGGGLIPSVIGTGTSVAKVATASDLMAKLIDVGVPGVIASTAWSGVQLSNTMTHSQIVDALVKNNVTETFANQIAGDVLNAFKSTPAKILFVAVAAGGAAWAFASFMGWSRRKTLITVAVVVLTAVVALLILCRAGIMNC